MIIIIRGLWHSSPLHVLCMCAICLLFVCWIIEIEPMDSTLCLPLNPCGYAMCAQCFKFFNLIIIVLELSGVPLSSFPSNSFVFLDNVPFTSVRSHEFGSRLLLWCTTSNGLVFNRRIWNGLRPSIEIRCFRFVYFHFVKRNYNAICQVFTFDVRPICHIQPTQSQFHAKFLCI